MSCSTRAPPHDCSHGVRAHLAFPFRANPFSKVTDLFCRFPLPTLFYWLESVKLRNLLRIFVRSGVKIILSPDFSRSKSDKLDSNMENFALLLFQAVLKAILLKMNLDSKRSNSARARFFTAAARATAQSTDNPFKKKRKLFLISPLPIIWHKFNVTIKNIYTVRRGRSFLAKKS